MIEEQTGEKNSDEPDKTKSRRVSVKMSEEGYQILQGLSTSSQRSMNNIFRNALGLVRIALEEEEKGNSLAVVNKKGKVLKEVVLPE